MRLACFSIILIFIFCVTLAAQESQRDNGIYLFQVGKYAEAVDVLRDAPETDKQHYAMWLYRGFSYLKLGNEPAASI